MRLRDQIAPRVGDVVISPSGKRWRVMSVFHPSHEEVYNLKSVDSNRSRSVYLREIAFWRKAEGGNDHE